MRVTTEATTPNNNNYKISRLGRIIGTGGFGVYGLQQSLKCMKSDEFITNMAKAVGKASDNGVNYYKGARKAAYVAGATAILALCGFVVGGIVDFIINRFAKNKAMKKAESSSDAVAKEVKPAEAQKAS